MPSATVLRVWGEDSTRYLQSQVTQDLSEGGCRLGLWLNARGKMEGESYLLQMDAFSFLLISFHTKEADLARLVDRHIIADDVEWQVMEGQYHALGFAEMAGGATFLEEHGLSLPDSGNYSRNDDGLLLFREERGPHPWFILLGPNSLLSPANEVSGGDQAWRRERILRKIPAIPGEMGSRDTPFDLDLAKPAVSFDKGCYLGQEVMAKLNSRGKKGRGLFRLVGRMGKSGLETVQDSAVFMEGREAGRILCDWADGEEWIGLAQLKTTGAEREGPLHLELAGDEIEGLRIF